MLGIILLIVTVLFPLIMTFIPFKTEILNPNKKKFTLAGWIFIFLGVLTVVAAAWLSSINGSDVQELKNGQDSLRTDFGRLSNKYDTHQKLDSMIGLAVDPKTNTLRIIDTPLLKSLFNNPTIDEKPVLELMSLSEGNPIFSINQDSIWNFTISINTNGKEVGANLKDKNTLICLVNGKFYLLGSTRDYAPNEKSLVTAIGSKIQYSGTIHYPNGFGANDTLYDYLKIDYTNRSGKPQIPFVGLYLVTKIFLNKSLPDAGGQRYREIESFLISRKAW